MKRRVRRAEQRHRSKRPHKRFHAPHVTPITIDTMIQTILEHYIPGQLNAIPDGYHCWTDGRRYWERV
jgi:hypothetical protein